MSIKVAIIILLSHLVNQTLSNTVTNPGNVGGVQFTQGEDAILKCTKGGKCKRGTLDATKTASITIDCEEYWACMDFVVKGPAGADKVTLNCKKKDACKQISLQTATPYTNDPPPKMVINDNLQEQNEGIGDHPDGACVCNGVKSDTLGAEDAKKCCVRPYGFQYKGSQGIVSQTKQDLETHEIDLKKGNIGQATKAKMHDGHTGIVRKDGLQGTYLAPKGGDTKGKIKKLKKPKKPMLFGKKTKRPLTWVGKLGYYCYNDNDQAEKVPDKDLPKAAKKRQEEEAKKNMARAQYTNEYSYYYEDVDDEVEYGIASAPVVPVYGYGYGVGFEAGGDQGISWMYWMPVVVMMMCMCGLCAFCGGGVLGYFIGVFMHKEDKMSYQSVQQDIV